MQHHASTPYNEMPDLLARLTTSSSTSALCLRLIALTACRSDEARSALWSEFDLHNAVWVIPASRTKTNKEHRIPLSVQAVQVLREAAKLRTKESELVFPSPTTRKALSDVAIGKLIPGATVHGLPLNVPHVVCRVHHVPA